MHNSQSDVNNASEKDQESQKLCIPSRESHSFDTGIAAAISLEAAIIYNHIAYWIRQNAARGINFYDGRTWTYETSDYIFSFLPYLSKDRIVRALRDLVDHGVLLKGNYNKNKFDKTAWYALNDQFEKTKNDDSTLQNSKKVSDEANLPHRNGESATSSNIYIKTHIEKTIDTRVRENPPADADEKKSSSSSKSKKKKEPDKPQTIALIQRRQHVKTSETQHNHLCQKYGEAKTEKYYDALNEWKDSKAEVDPKALGKHSDFYRITKWVAKDTDAQEQEQKKQPSPGIAKADEDQTAINHERWKAYIKFHWSKAQELRVYIADRGNCAKIGHDEIHYNELKFDDLVKHALRKVGL